MAEIEQEPRKDGLRCVYDKCHFMELGQCNPGCSFTMTAVDPLEMMRQDIAKRSSAAAEFSDLRHQLAQSQAEVGRLRVDARRYRRLQILGCAPGTSPQLNDGTVLCFTNLDAFVDADLRVVPSRGEAFPLAPDARTTAGEAGKVFRAPLVWKDDLLILGRIGDVGRCYFDEVTKKWPAFCMILKGSKGFLGLFDTREQAVAAAEAAVLALAGAGE